MSLPRVWLVTGASSGFGRLLTELALSHGDNVVATLRNPSALSALSSTYPASRLLVHQLDVTAPAAIPAAFAAAHAQFGRVDVVLNNAGYGLLAEVEGTPDEVARGVFETNFWGAANVSREAVRVFREVNPKGVGGRLLTVSSFVGLKPLPCAGYYSASKFALEALTDSLAHELDPSWNIKVSLIEPGTFKTAALTKSAACPAPEAYSGPTVPAAQVRKMLEGLGGMKLGDPKKAVAKIWELAGLADPPLRLVLGKDAFMHARGQLESVTTEIAKYESWSDDLQED